MKEQGRRLEEKLEDIRREYKEQAKEGREERLGLRKEIDRIEKRVEGLEEEKGKERTIEGEERNAENEDMKRRIKELYRRESNQMSRAEIEKENITEKYDNCSENNNISGTSNTNTLKVQQKHLQKDVNMRRYDTSSRTTSDKWTKNADSCVCCPIHNNSN
ncbi:PREDICTED: rab GTPase-activating protein 1-like, partial [Vollenhovia emeryi]|uniref:rab GTPase-activating protein 1-like n=1 Tax=Vollenhovia emeryi TaxID=411798 RepID=UPI0005F46187